MVKGFHFLDPPRESWSVYLKKLMNGLQPGSFFWTAAKGLNLCCHDQDMW